MPPRSDTKAFEAAVQALLAPLAAHARGAGISSRRFASIVSAAAHGRIGPVTPALPYDTAVRLVSRWSTDPRYSRRGRPRALLPRGANSFATLVRGAKAGPANHARRALVDAGVVREDSRGTLTLLQNAYIPRGGGAPKLEILGQAGAEFLRVLTHNLRVPPDESFLQRAASYDNIGSSSLMTLRKALRREGLRALGRANQLLAVRDRDRNVRAAGGRRTRVSFGVYLLEEPMRASRKGR